MDSVKPTRLIVVAVLLVATLCIATLGIATLGIVRWRWSNSETPSDNVSAAGQRSTGQRSAENNIVARSSTVASHVDQQVCAECHAQIVADYERSGMSQTWQTASLRPLSILAPPTPVEDHVSGYRYEVKQTGRTFEQVETRSDDAQHELRRTADYFVGSGKNAIAMVTAQQGYLTQLPVAWFRGEPSCRMNPGFELQNHRFSRPVTPGCIACHGTEAVHTPPTRNRFQLPIAEGIGCRRCHGSAKKHVDYWSSAGGTDTADTGETRHEQAALVHPGRLSPEQSNDLCLQCHLQGDVTLYRAGSDPFHFSPGDRLQDHRHDYLVDSGEPATLGVASHGARMLQSRCYTASGGRLTCLLCHDPHRPANDFEPAYYDSKCATCHTPEACNRPRETPETEATTGGCVECHMPQRGSREGIHLVFTDHAMLRQKLAPDRVAPPPDVLPRNADVELTSCWPGDVPTAANLGAAYVLLHETMGPQLPALERGRRLLTEAVSRDPLDQESRYWLASAIVAQGQGQQAIPYFREILARDPQRQAARFRLAIAYELAGDYLAAIPLYEQLVDEVPVWLEPYPRLAQLYLSRQQFDRAVLLLTQQLSYQEDALAFAQLALAERLRGDSHDAALATVTKALQLDPRLPTAYLNRAGLFLLAGQRKQAEADFKRVLELDANNPQARQALQALSR